jgi:hypothetical protein
VKIVLCCSMRASPFQRPGPALSGSPDSRAPPAHEQLDYQLAAHCIDKETRGTTPHQGLFHSRVLPNPAQVPRGRCEGCAGLVTPCERENHDGDVCSGALSGQTDRTNQGSPDDSAWTRSAVSSGWIASCSFVFPFLKREKSKAYHQIIDSK